MILDEPNYSHCGYADCSGWCHPGLGCDIVSESEANLPTSPTSEWSVYFDELVCRFCPSSVGADQAGRNVAEARHKAARRPLKGQRRLF